MPHHTISRRREALVGGVAILSSPAKRRALSLDVLSISRKRSISLGTGSMGMQRVARSTWDAVLQEQHDTSIYMYVYTTVQPGNTQ